MGNVYKRQGADFRTDIARGNISGTSFVNKYGRNSDIDTATDPEDIWDGGGLWVPPTTARTHDIASTSANDIDTTGSGARTIFISGLDANWAEQSETIELDGTNNVPTANTYTRINRMYILTAGSTGVNEGNITATAQTDATVTAQMTAGYGQTFMAIWTVPAGKTAYLTQYYASVEKAAAAEGVAEMTLVAVYNVDTATKATRFKHYFGLDTNATSHVEHTFCIPEVYPEKTDVLMRCNVVSANDFDIGAGFTMFYE